MATKKDPAITVVAFFENAPLETAQTVLAICKSVVSRRQPTKVAKPRVVKSTRQNSAITAVAEG